MTNDTIPVFGEHRGVPLHAGQSPERLAVVCGDVDAVLDEADPTRLLALAGNVALAPEARLLAAARLVAAHDLAVEKREARPVVDPQLARAAVAGLASSRWQSPTHFCSLLDAGPAPGGPRPVARAEPLR
jgi:hypothetical protein